MLATGMDDTFQAVARELPEPIRAFGEQLPYRLGLTRTPEGRWEEFWVLDINRDLPGYAAELPGGWLVPPEALGHYRAAHHCAVIHGLIADRLADRQVPPDSRFHVLRRAYRLAWERELTTATGDAGFARHAIARALRSLRRGTAMEQRSLARRRLDPATYAVQTREKLRWGGASAWCMLQHAREPVRALMLERSYDLFCFALQCLDDALDCGEDERNRGTSVPAVLGVPLGALVRATPRLVASAIAHAEQAGLPRMVRWLISFSSLVSRLDPGGDAEVNERAGWLIAETAEEVL